ncbi:hypothetical protein PEX1_098930 [Penicillium expansum]|uniref:Uncharacterized protein n=1 Tax=Penicillium expansum TaxID=27334 RepID=A0A0A2KVA4_PENEN|nr:hypothetical protein PEX2_028310 [Penicillium expansum]KGO46511.1 hypothetical protein PEXP_066800 [Penicillium expansum]KGO50266.1 hypothetical protein PEX2_028310 [Penicillium expansum]KGO70868.1 hypothetical protein PEX1_098930 [Penicillium expansum]
MAKKIATHLILIAGLLSVVILVAKFQSNYFGLQSRFLFTDYSSGAPYKQAHIDVGQNDIACSGVHGSGTSSHCRNGQATDEDRRYPGFDKDMSQTHHIVYSVSNANRKYFKIDFGKRSVLNPSIIPHPELLDTWIITAQLRKLPSARTASVWYAELVCNAAFSEDRGVLSCLEPPLQLPIPATFGDSTKCLGDLSYFSLSVGPHDARVFYGPEIPYTVYGSNSFFTCFGQWISDFRILVDWGIDTINEHEFRQYRELQRPMPWSSVEKNWFLFWDDSGRMFIHHEIAPTRVFSKLELDGSVGPNLAPNTAASDQQCLKRFLPETGKMHQATNSLAITLCARSDHSCQPDATNTFVLFVVQQKTLQGLRPLYEPYVVLMRRSVPFEIYAVSSKPIWIFGRSMRAEKSDEDSSSGLLEDASEMLYMTSISWKSHGQKYHGFIDDTLFLAFGREDSDAGGIDVTAGDLLAELGMCAGL